MPILVVRNNSNQQAIEASLLLSSYLTEQNIPVYVVDSSSLGNDSDREEIRLKLPDNLDLVIVLGGDGTVLHTLHLLDNREVPLLPVNFGRLGFLANAGEEGLLPLVTQALAGELIEDKRSMLCVDIVCAGEIDPYSDGETSTPGNDNLTSVAYPHDELPEDHFGVNINGLSGSRSFFAFNEAAITRGSLGRIIEFNLSINGINVANMRGDGIVVSTATGSTAYALSAGGPLVSPGFKGLLAVPLAPHTLSSRAIITDANDVIEITFDETETFRKNELFLDGEIILLDKPLKKIYIKRGSFEITILRALGTSFYERISQDFFRK